MTKYNTRDHIGRFTKSGAPISQGDDHEGDPSAMEHVVSPSSDPLGEHDEHLGTVYPQHTPVRQSPLRPRHGIVIDAQKGQRLSNAMHHEMRGIDTYLGGGNLRAQAHVEAAQGDPFIERLMSRPIYDHTRRGHEHMGDPADADNDNASHTAWTGEVGQPMRDR